MRVQTSFDASSQGASWRRALESWDLRSIRRAVQVKTGWSDALAFDVEREYRRFLSLLMLAPGEEFGMAGLVDEYWHMHVLHTREYASLCEDVFGRFIHHCPSTEQGTRSFGAYVRTLDALRAAFGNAPAHIWPSPETAIRCATGRIDAVARSIPIN
jgi:hypothetical protein